MVDVRIPFFKASSVLKHNNYKVVREKSDAFQNPVEYLKELSGKYYVLAKSYNKLVFGILSDGSLSLSDGKEIELKYLLSLRAFNEKEDVLFELRNQSWYMVKVQDELTVEAEAEGKVYCAVDSISPLFGDCKSESNGFAELVEKGRKIILRVPSLPGDGLYALVTRSYIEYSEVTGQAGYGFYRLVGLERV